MERTKRVNNYSNYKFYVDISGRVNKDDIYVGCILMPSSFKSAFIDQFYKEFSELRSFNKKSSDLNNNKLREVIEFMDLKRIKMCCYHLPIQQFQKGIGYVTSTIKNITGKEPINIRNKEERLLSLAYFYALRHHAWENCHYDVVCCAETQIKLVHLITYLQRHSYMNNYPLHISFNWRRHEHALKFADFVAGAGKKIDKEILNNIAYFRFLDNPIDTRDIYKVFSINKISYNNKK